MVTKKSRPRGHRVIGAFLCLLLTAPFIASGFQQSNRQIEANIECLRNAQDRLEKNPRDTTALSLILSLLRDSNAINRANAAAVLGQTGERIGAEIKDQAVPPLIHLLETGGEGDRYAACTKRPDDTHRNAVAAQCGRTRNRSAARCEESGVLA